MKKRSLLLSLVLTLYLCMAMSMPAWAADVESKTEQIKQGIEAYLLSPDGEKLDLEIVDVKTKPLVNIGIGKAGMLNTPVLLSSEVKVKTSTAAYSKYGIDANASLTMTWVDVAGVKNEIKNLTGYFVIAKGTFKSGVLCWGAEYGSPTFAPYRVAISESFNEDIYYVSDDETDGTVRTHACANIISPTDSKVHQFSIMVCPTIFD